MSCFQPLCLWTSVGVVLAGNISITLATVRKDANLINYTKNITGFTT
jgi:hypothetical protein